MLIRSLLCHISAIVFVTAVSGNSIAQEATPAKVQDAAPAQEDVPKLETINDKAGYAIGFNIGKDLKRQGLALDPQTIAKGIAAALEGKESVFTDKEVQEVFTALREQLAQKKLESNKKFLEENKAKEGVKVTKSGLQYLVIKEGTGAKPTKASTVSTHYRGTLLDGTVFDESYKEDAPADGEEPRSFGVSQVIKGWTEGLQLMTVGSHYRMFIPSELAYGENGPGQIGANAVLIFDVYLVGSDG